MPSTPMTVTARRLAARVAGYAFVVAFLALTAAGSHLIITFFAPMTFSSSGEATFWLGHALLLFPGACLLGYGYAESVGPLLARWGRAIDAADRRRLAAGLAAAAVLFVLAARIGHSAVLFDYPITDDEGSARFGGQILATGHATAPVFEPFDAFPRLFLIARDGWMASSDTLGAQVAWAVAELTGLGPLVFAIAAGATAVFLALAAARRRGPAAGALALLVFAFSPMALSLGMTTRAEVVARAMVALAICLVAWAENASGARGDALRALAGLAFGLGVCCVPAETFFLLAPILAASVAWARAGRGRAALAVAVGAALPLALMGLHAWALTGSPFLLPSRAPGAFVPVYPPRSLWHRFGSVVSYNTLTLAVWFLGPLGLALVARGAAADRFARYLALGVACALGYGIFTDAPGLHVVGPLLYEGSAVPLTLVAVSGFYALREDLHRLGADSRAFAAAVAFALTVGLGAFDVVHALALRDQAEIQRYYYSSIEREVRGAARGERAVVLAPPFSQLWDTSPEFTATGTWVFEWRRPRPDAADDILFLLDDPAHETDPAREGALRKRFPGRRFFRLTATLEEPYFDLVELDPNPA